MIDDYEAFVVDLDGVVWRGDEFVGGSCAALSSIVRRAKRLLLLTNNASYPVDRIVERLARQGVHLTGEQVLNPAVVARHWVATNELVGCKAMILASQEVTDQLKDVVEVIDPLHRGADLVIVGRDVEFDYQRLASATAAIRSGASLVCMNRDETLPVAGGFEPGTGAIVAAVEAGSGVQAVSMGKPEAAMMDAARSRIGTTGVLMIGDRVDSDVAGAQRNGWDSALVMTGVADRDEVFDPKPNYVLDDLAQLLQK